MNNVSKLGKYIDEDLFNGDTRMSWVWYEDVGVKNIGGSVFEIDLGEEYPVQVSLFQLGICGPLVMGRILHLSQS